MEFKLNKIDKCKEEIEFDVPQDELIPHFEKAYSKYRNKASIPGFRKGKAPVSIIKKMYGEAIEYNSLEEIANDIFNGYLKDNHVHSLGSGFITDMKYEPESTFKFKIQYEIKPEIELKEYKGIEITKPVYKVDDKLVEDEINFLRSKHSAYENAENAGGDGFVLTLDIQKLDKNQLPIIGENQKDLKIYLNDSELNSELKEQLKDFSLNEERLLRLKAQDKNGTELYKAKAVKIEKVILPELDTEFFNKVSKKDIKDANEFRGFIRADLENIYKSVSEQGLKNNIISELIKLNDVPIPESMVKNILNSYIDDIKNRNPKRELPPDFNEEEFRKTKRVDAVLQVKWYLIRDKIIDNEKIEVTESDIEPLIEADSIKYSIPAEKLRNLYKNNHDVKFKIQDKKVMNFLIINSKIKEVIQSNEPAIVT